MGNEYGKKFVPKRYSAGEIGYNKIYWLKGKFDNASGRDTGRSQKGHTADYAATTVKRYANDIVIDQGNIVIFTLIINVDIGGKLYELLEFIDESFGKFFNSKLSKLVVEQSFPMMG